MSSSTLTTKQKQVILNTDGSGATDKILTTTDCPAVPDRVEAKQILKDLAEQNIFKQVWSFYQLTENGLALKTELLKNTDSTPPTEERPIRRGKTWTRETTVRDQTMATGVKRKEVSYGLHLHKSVLCDLDTEQTLKTSLQISINVAGGYRQPRYTYTLFKIVDSPIQSITGEFATKLPFHHHKIPPDLSPAPFKDYVLYIPAEDTTLVFPHRELLSQEFTQNHGLIPHTIIYEHTSNTKHNCMERYEVELAHIPNSQIKQLLPSKYHEHLLSVQI